MSSSLRRSPGFTLVEVMVAVVITGVVSVSLAQMLSVGQRSADRNRIMSEMQQNARVGIQSLSDDLRHVSYGKDPTQPSIFYAGPDSVEFVADLLDDNAGAERVSYFLSSEGDPDTPNPNDTILMKVVRDTMGVVLYSAPQAYGIAPGGLDFRWFNGGGVELANPVPQPELVGEVMVTLTVAASREIAGTYPQMTLSSTIYPRNLPLSPARSRPSNPGFVSLESPDCERATLTWTTPTTNTDATELDPLDIGYFALYLGTDPDDLDLYTKLARTTNQWTISGLSDGPVYYLAVTCVSRSGVESYRCGGAIDLTWTPVPKAPVNLHFGAGAGTILAWDPVTLFTNDEAITTPVSYRIYRGVAAGFAATDATRRGTVTATTTWTDSSAVVGNTYYYRVQAKACRNEESTGSNEVSNCAVNLQLWSNTAAGETMTLLTPTFTGGALVQEVWYGSPLVKIWAGDGSAGGDGNVGARPSGSVLNIEDSSVPFFTALPDGRPLRVVFSSALYGVKLGLGFQGATGFCAATTSPSPAWTVEDFGGTYSGWTDVGAAGTWSHTTTGELQQTVTTSNYMVTNNEIGVVGDCLTMEAKVKVTNSGSHSLYLAFRVQDVNNYYLFGVKTGTNSKVLVQSVKAGTSTPTTPTSLVSLVVTLADATWYTLRVQVTGGPANVNIKGWVDGVQHVNFTDTATTWATGKIGLAARKSAGRFDNLRVYAGSPLP